jgi:hypothetical protein
MLYDQVPRSHRSSAGRVGSWGRRLDLLKRPSGRVRILLDSDQRKNWGRRSPNVRLFPSTNAWLLRTKKQYAAVQSLPPSPVLAARR